MLRWKATIAGIAQDSFIRFTARYATSRDPVIGQIVL